jgi:hypothetical protein
LCVYHRFDDEVKDDAHGAFTPEMMKLLQATWIKKFVDGVTDKSTGLPYSRSLPCSRTRSLMSCAQRLYVSTVGLSRDGFTLEGGRTKGGVKGAEADCPDEKEVEKTFWLSRPDGWVINKKTKRIIMIEFKRRGRRAGMVGGRFASSRRTAFGQGKRVARGHEDVWDKHRGRKKNLLQPRWSTAVRA